MNRNEWNDSEESDKIGDGREKEIELKSKLNGTMEQQWMEFAAGICIFYWRWAMRGLRG